MKRVLIVGASGYIGSRLAERLSKRGEQLTLMSRDVRGMAARFPRAKVVAADLLDPATLAPALADIDVAYYLAHSMAAGERGFAERDKQAAQAFAQAAAKANLGRIVYLGGLGEESAQLSAHLASRQRTGTQLAATGVPVTEFRAAVIIGSGSASFEILRYLTERLPVMITPRWVSTRSQPIGISDVLDYLVGALDHPELTGVVEIGGPEVLTYGAMIRAYARQRGLRRLMIPVPVLTPRLSSYWVSLVTPIPSGLARPLIEGMRNEVVVRNPGPAAAFGMQPMVFEEALRQAIDRTRDHQVESTWFDSFSLPNKSELPPASSREGMIVDRKQVWVAAHPEQVFDQIERLGGQTGWLYANSLWRLRGLVDLIVGGVGMRLGRRDPRRLRVGDALDFWRVEKLERPSLLRLRAEMRVPGRAWLQFEIGPSRRGRSGGVLTQTAFFEPKGLPGLAYWYLLYPIHALIFRGMIRALARRAGRAAATAGRTA
jgi:uncharacterized protein YbjT (DUF2867 family)